MNTIYFIRHAQSDRFTKDDRTRPLTEEGMADSAKVTDVLKDMPISHILSSPYTRAIQTVSGLAEKKGLSIEQVEDFRERNAGGWHGEDFLKYIEKQWADHNYSIMGGECLAECQSRNIHALENVMATYPNETLAIGTHGTALSTIINYYKPEFGFESFMRILDMMPYVVRMDIDEGRCTLFEEVLSVHKEYK